MSSRRTLAAIAVGAALSLGAAAPASALLLPDPGPPVPSSPRAPETPRATKAPVTLASAVRVEDVLADLEALQAIADAHGGARAAGTRGHEAAAEYVEAQLAAAGYDTWRQSFPFTYEEVRSSTLTSTVAQTTSPQAHLPMAQSPATPSGGVSGRLVTPTVAQTGCTAGDWARVDANASVALVTRGGCTFADKARHAQAAGAAALIVMNDAPGAFVGALGGHPREHLPTVGVPQETGRALLDLPADATVTVTIDKLVEERETFSVLAQTRSGSEDGVVMLGAHLDGGDEGPGINDNGTGNAVLLETARELARIRSTPTAVRFAWWGASRLDNLGSRSYVSTLAAEDAEALQRIGIYVDVDAVASPNHIIGVQDPAGAGSVLADHLDSLGRAWVETTPPADSDARAFIERGIPSTGISTGTTGSKTPREAELFGGTTGLPYDPNNGTVADNLGNVDLDVLRITTAAVAHAAQALASR